MPDTVDITYGTLQGIRGLTMPLHRGCTPSIGTLYVRPQTNVTTLPSTLSFGHGSSRVELRDVALGACFLRGLKRPILACQIFDRRWRWQFTSVSGTYNRRLASGIVDTYTQKQPGELASLILQQMGESNYDVSRMPTGVYPPASWNATRGDLALAELCDYVACEVVLNPLTNGVEIWPLGTGQPTPDTGMLPKYRYIPRSNVPATIEVHCGESLYQYRLKLEALGRSTGLEQKKLSSVDWMSGLSTTTQGLTFPGVDTQLKSALALDTGWREYRVVSQEGGNLNVPGLSVAISNVRQYVLRDTLVYSVLDDTRQRYYRLPYYVEGDFWPGGDTAATTSNQVYIGPSSLDTSRQIVKFPTPVVKISSTDGTITEPTLYLQTAYSVQDENGSRWRYVYTANVGGGSGKLIIRRPEIWASYASTGNTEAQAALESSKYATLFQQKFSNSLASELTYRGIASGSLDGNIAQCVWSIRPGQAPTTRVSEVEECDQYSTPRQERRRRERLARLLEVA